jgi:hypothetical protein
MFNEIFLPYPGIHSDVGVFTEPSAVFDGFPRSLNGVIAESENLPTNATVGLMPRIVYERQITNALINIWLVSLMHCPPRDCKDKFGREDKSAAMYAAFDGDACS